MTLQDVCAAVKEVTGQDVDSATRLDDVVEDSLEFMEVIVLVSSRCGEILDSVVPRINTVDDLFLAASGELG